MLVHFLDVITLKTGVFFHNSFSKKPWPIIGSKFRNFPKAMEYALDLPNVVLYKPTPVSESLLLQVHDLDFINQTKGAWYYEGARLSVGGCVEAAEKIWLDEITNALVFDVAAGHHAGPSQAWGGTYLSCNGPVVAYMRKKYCVQRFAILDTDSHHGDGDRAMFRGDKDILHVCFCGTEANDDNGTKIDVNVGWSTTDAKYLTSVHQEFFQRLEQFKPEMVIHVLGHDLCQGDYGDRGLTTDLPLRLVDEVRDHAEETCGGKYLVVTHGGSRIDYAESIFPKVIEILSHAE
jgi:acetoin utilization deacetylase AcuC-like enzyme